MQGKTALESIGGRVMQGMELSKKYYETYGKAMIEAVCGRDRSRVAVGLGGEGSQCFGYDDELSQDHDFGPGFCMWLNDEDMPIYGEKLAAEYERLPNSFMGFSRQNIQDKSRVGVIGISDFFYRNIGISKPPETNSDWFFLRETQLALCTNGEIFADELGEFTKFREALKSFYPEDVLRKKIAARAAEISQSGQYNLMRCLKRGDDIAAILSVSRFTEAVLSMAHLLNRRYMPFYKWSYMGAKDLEKLKKPVELLPELKKIFLLETRDRENFVFDITESICEEIAKELVLQGFSHCDDSFLQEHIPHIMAGIKDEKIRKLPAHYDLGI